MALINSPSNGATERPGSSNHSLFVFLAGPIRYWWTPTVENSDVHKLYTQLRDIAHNSLSEEFLVYAPNRAWRGPWDSRAQAINDAAVAQCDAFVYLRVAGVPAEGTDEEMALANSLGKPVFAVDCTTVTTFYNTLSAVAKQLFAMDTANNV